MQCIVRRSLTPLSVNTRIEQTNAAIVYFLVEIKKLCE